MLSELRVVPKAKCFNSSFVLFFCQSGQWVVSKAFVDHC